MTSIWRRKAANLCYRVLNEAALRQSYLKHSGARNTYIDLLRRAAARHTQLDETVPDTRISPQTQMELSA
jgi:hypothetical protein